MSTLLYTVGDETGTPADAELVRSTTATLSPDAVVPEAADPPDWNERETDGNPALAGLNNRQVASDWHEAIKGPNAVAAQASAVHNNLVNERVASDGRAPALEESSPVFGHGSVSFAIGIEPTIRDGATMGSDYFAANPTGSQEGIPQVLTPAPGYDRSVSGDMAAAGKDRARDATQAGALYAAYYAATVG